MFIHAHNEFDGLEQSFGKRSPKHELRATVTLNKSLHSCFQKPIVYNCGLQPLFDFIFLQFLLRHGDFCKNCQLGPFHGGSRSIGSCIHTLQRQKAAQGACIAHFWIYQFAPKSLSSHSSGMCVMVTD